MKTDSSKAVPQLSPELKSKLIALANKYECATFPDDDPCQFMHRSFSLVDKEVVAFIASSLAFGKREQIILHVDSILKEANPSPTKWILNSGYKSFFPNDNKYFYRVFSNKNMINFFDKLKQILSSNKTLGTYFKNQYEQNKAIPLYKIICAEFKGADCGNLIPQTENSACKRVQLFLRWMVRGSKDCGTSIDLGLWTWYNKKDLLMPLDVHVLQEAVKFGLLPKTASGKIPAATIKMATLLTEEMKSIWPDDPLKGDFALFGLGVDN